MENLTPCKYKTDKDIEKPFGIYHYVAESNCCVKIYRNRITHFWCANRGSFSFFTYKQTIKQTNKQTISFISPTGHKMYRLERSNAHNTWFQVQMCLLESRR